MASQELGKGASLVGVHDAGNLFTATTVEGALKEAITQANSAFTSASNGKTAIKNAVAGLDPTVVIPADPTFAQLAAGIGKISTGKKWASGTTVLQTGHPFYSDSFYNLGVAGLGFTPSNIVVLLKNGNGSKVFLVGLYYSNGKSVQGFYTNLNTNWSTTVTLNGNDIRFDNATIVLANSITSSGFNIKLFKSPFSNTTYTGEVWNLEWLAFE